VNSTNVPRRRNTPRNGSSSADHDPGKITHRTVPNRTVAPIQAPTTTHREAPYAAPTIMKRMPTAIDQATRTAVTQRIGGVSR
jgi:hypothetical protein